MRCARAIARLKRPGLYTIYIFDTLFSPFGGLLFTKCVIELVQTITFYICKISFLEFSNSNKDG